jgi:hypothetical protein
VLAVVAVAALGAGVMYWYRSAKLVKEARDLAEGKGAGADSEADASVKVEESEKTSEKPLEK